MNKTRPRHTPGPWDIAYNDPLTVHRNTSDKTYRFVAFTDSRHDTGCQDDSRTAEDIANARLIAAAPDIYGVCELVLLIEAHNADNRDYPTVEQWNEIVKASRAAIKKAEVK